MKRPSGINNGRITHDYGIINYFFMKSNNHDHIDIYLQNHFCTLKVTAYG
jgi:hypothetical protein